MRKSFYCSGPGRSGIPLTVQERVRSLNDKPVRQDAEYVLYWSQMNRRVASNHALAYAIEQANELGLPLLVYEGLTCHATRMRMTGSTRSCSKTCRISRRRQGPRRSDTASISAESGRMPNDVVYRLARQAALVVTDDYPTFIAAKHNASVPAGIDVAYHAVDSSCIVPMNRFPNREYAAYTIRPKMHRLLPEYLHPLTMPVFFGEMGATGSAVPHGRAARDVPSLVASCDIDHTVKPSTTFRGGYRAARQRPGPLRQQEHETVCRRA